MAQNLQLKVGMSKRDLKPAVGIPLAGYGSALRRLKPIDWKRKIPHSFFFKPSEGVRDPIFSKVMIIDDGISSVIFISMDMIGVTQRFVKSMSKKLAKHGFTKDQIFITGTHTHSGSGTLSKVLPLNLVASDLFVRKNYKYIVEQTYQSVLEALDNMEPAELYSSSFMANDIQENKFRRKGEKWFNRKASFLLAKSTLTGYWLGGMMNFAMHGNAMHVEDMRYSGDIPGALARVVEENLAAQNKILIPNVPILFMNGAEGDVKHKGQRGEEIMEEVANQFAEQAKSALEVENMMKVEPVLSYSRKMISMGTPAYPLKVCAKRDGWYRNWMKIIPSKTVKIPLFPFFPVMTYLSAVRIGHIAMMTWPGEASTSLGYKLQGMALSEGFQESWVLGLTNDYLTYFTTKEEFFEAHYDSCSSMYGWRAGDYIIKGQKKLLKLIK